MWQEKKRALISLRTVRGNLPSSFGEPRSRTGPAALCWAPPSGGPAGELRGDNGHDDFTLQQCEEQQRPPPNPLLAPKNGDAPAAAAANGRERSAFPSVAAPCLPAKPDRGDAATSLSSPHPTGAFPGDSRASAPTRPSRRRLPGTLQEPPRPPNSPRPLLPRYL